MTWALILFSAAVVGYWQPLGLVVTLALTAFTWLLIRLAQGASAPRRRVIVSSGVSVLVLTLIAFGYVPWFLALLRGTSTPETWVVPLGLSFTVFRLIGAVFDSVALRLPASPRQLLLLALFFPTYRAGPIETLSSLTPLPQGGADGRGTRWALERIVLGVCRKVILADPLQAYVIGPWLAGGVDALSGPQCLLMPFLFGLRLYWDFSGYSDIAIGTAALLGYRVRENFDRPYLSTNLVEFWSRWHITLSEWIRIRLFIKLAGRRAPKWRFHFATVVSMAICGLWHGAGTNFLVWGLWHGVGLVVVHLFRDGVQKRPVLLHVTSTESARLVSIALTYVYVSIGWLAFFLPLDRALRIASGAIRWSPGEGLAAPGVLVAGVIVLVAAPVILLLDPRRSGVPATARAAVMSIAGGVALYLLLLHRTALQDFIYAQF